MRFHGSRKGGEGLIVPADAGEPRKQSGERQAAETFWPSSAELHLANLLSNIAIPPVYSPTASRVAYHKMAQGTIKQKAKPAAGNAKK